MWYVIVSSIITVLLLFLPCEFQSRFEALTAFDFLAAHGADNLGLNIYSPHFIWLLSSSSFVFRM